MLRLGATISRVRPGSSWSSGAQIVRGLGDLGHATAAPTRQGASGGFTKATVQARGAPALGPTWSLGSVVLAQTSFGRPLPRAEQFQLEGPDAVSAFVGGVTAVDEGATSRLELARRTAIGPVTVLPYLFAASGWGRVARPSAAEPDALKVAAFGAGTRVGLFGGRVELAGEYAHGR